MSWWCVCGCEAAVRDGSSDWVDWGWSCRRARATQPHEPLLGRWVASRRGGRSEREVLPSKQARRSSSMVNFISTKTRTKTPRHSRGVSCRWRLPFFLLFKSRGCSKSLTSCRHLGPTGFRHKVWLPRIPTSKNSTSPNSHLPLEQHPVHTHWQLPDPADSAPRKHHTPHTRRLNRRIGSSQPQWPPSEAEESCGRGPAHHHRHHPPNPLAPPSSPTAASSRAP